MSYSIFTASALFASRFEPKTIAEANAAAVVRVVRWFAVALAIAAALTIAAAWLALQLGLAAYNATEGAPQGYEQYLEPIGPQPAAVELTLEQLQEASESLPIGWPTEMPSFEAEATAPQPAPVVATDEALAELTELAELPVKELRRMAQLRGLSIRRDGRVLRKPQLLAALAQ
jgi:hypothetical protein